MDRLACVDVPALPLQLLLRAHPEWRASPVALVESDRPQGLILAVNRAAQRSGVLAGMRAGTARSLAPSLCTGVISGEEIARGSGELLLALREFSARVEPAEGEPGLFWLDASGLLHLFESLESWAAALRSALEKAKLLCAICVGYQRFACAAVAKALRGQRALVFDSPLEEERAAARVPLSRAGLPPETLAALEQLGVQTLGEFLRLPAAGILRRFGPEAHRLRRQAAGELAAPLRPLAPEEPLRLVLELDDAESDRARLTFLAKQLLDALLAKLASRGEAASELFLQLGLHSSQSLRDPSAKRARVRPAAEEICERLRPAAPTLEAAQLVNLLHLRLDALALPAGVVRLSLTARAAPATREQLEMHAQAPKRDLAAAARAFARLRAAFGESAVVHARLEPGHLPEARYSWEPLAALPPAQPRPGSPRQLIRRVNAKALALPPRESREPDGWLITGLSGGRVVKLDGPHRLSGGWWQRELERDYYFAETSLGELLWIFYDRRRRCWQLQGAVA